MTQHSNPTDIGALYDQITDMYAALLGGNIHSGYWEDDIDDRPIKAATDRLTDMVADRLALTEGQHVLDVGCGNGNPAVHIATGRNVHVTGVTVSPYQVQLGQASPHCGNLPGNVSFQLADAMNLPNEAASFDGAYAIESISYMTDIAAVFGHVARVLRPGARFVFTDLYLREAPDERDAPIVTKTYESHLVNSCLTAEVIQEHLDRAGLDLVEFTDIRENIQPTFDIVIDGIRRASSSFDEQTDALFTEYADLFTQFSTVKAIGYAMVTAVRTTP